VFKVSIKYSVGRGVLCESPCGEGKKKLWRTNITTTAFIITPCFSMGVSNPLIACRASAPRSGLKPGGKLRLMAPSLKAGVSEEQYD